MAAGKEIRTQIRSIQNTQKITRAMEMVAASKMRRAQERMSAARPYADKLRNVIGHIANAHPEYKHPFMLEREVRRVAFIVISTDRGLCGGLNANEFRQLLREMQQWRKQNVEMEFGVIGNKATMFLRRIRAHVIAQTTHLGDAPGVSDVIGAVKVALDAYSEGRVDRLYLVYNRFINSMTQRPEIEQLLPLVPSEEVELKHYWDYLYEPGSQEVLQHVLVRYIEALVYQGVVENIACEQAARMVAMKAASDNAGNLIEELQLVYNKARQAAITKELSEIVAGAAAV
ncbi:F0F1 ATP synthase subunit gamma [Nitrococcus mobilis]|uniref:ATP synthase gamma chain n=1 Tax=Nitrococcus mobilis Nb-231 TaxID=314278 RepID=A4BNZ5_9GAMM|nr:F0F1 ATP synthase subunit gamma [Nitrococcus mobilis]EAR22944.1 Sodium-transporting two-sector ATPase [Nitrococcus mobilis Nb-231]